MASFLLQPLHLQRHILLNGIKTFILVLLPNAPEGNKCGQVHFKAEHERRCETATWLEHRLAPPGRRAPPATAWGGSATGGWRWCPTPGDRVMQDADDAGSNCHSCVYLPPPTAPRGGDPRPQFLRDGGATSRAIGCFTLILTETVLPSTWPPSKWSMAASQDERSAYSTHAVPRLQCAGEVRVKNS